MKRASLQNDFTPRQTHRKQLGGRSSFALNRYCTSMPSPANATNHNSNRTIFWRLAFQSPELFKKMAISRQVIDPWKARIGLASGGSNGHRPFCPASTTGDSLDGVCLFHPKYPRQDSDKGTRRLRKVYTKLEYHNSAEWERCRRVWVGGAIMSAKKT
jgi:hypothetical protein